MPQTVLDDIRQQLESARHLIDDSATDPLQRFAKVTRVHVLCILRNAGSNSRYSRWYRDAHHSRG